MHIRLFYPIPSGKCNPNFSAKAGNQPKLVLAAAALGNNFFGDVLGNLHIAVGLHGVLAAALSAGPQVGGIAEHLAQGNQSVDLLGADRASMPWIWPRRLFRSPMTSPM